MEQLKAPQIGEWCTLAYAAETIGVSLRTVRRLIIDGRLVGHKPRVGSRETARGRVILSAKEVHEYARAFKMTTRAPR